MTGTETLAPERVAVLRRRAWRVVLVVAVPVALVLGGIGVYAGRWLFVPVGVASGFFLGGVLGGLVTMPTTVATLEASFRISGLDRRRARRVARAIRRNDPGQIDEHEVQPARQYAEMRLRVRTLSGPSLVCIAAMPVLLLPVLVAARETVWWLVVLAASAWVLAAFLLVGWLREGATLQRFLSGTAGAAAQGGGAGR